MVETRQFINNKVMTDFDYSVIPENGMVDALNIKINNTKEGSMGVVTDLKGTTLVQFGGLRSGNYYFVGGGGSDTLQKYWSFFEHDGGYNIVLEYNKATNSIEKIIEDLTDTRNVPTLNISKDHPFTGFDIIDLNSAPDFYELSSGIMLTWTTDNSEPRSLFPDKHKVKTITKNVKAISNTFISDNDGVFDKSIVGKHISVNGSIWLKVIGISADKRVLTIDSFFFGSTIQNATSFKLCTKGVFDYDDSLLAKNIPICPIKASYVDRAGQGFNFLTTDLFQFTYSYVYEDGQISAWSPYSNLALPKSTLRPSSRLFTETSNSMVLLYKTGGKSVTHVKIAFRKVSGTDNGFYVIEEVDKLKAGIIDNTDGTIEFKNDGNYIPLPIANFINNVFDNVPLIAGTQALINGNQIVYGDIVLGQDEVELDMALTLGFKTLVAEGVSGVSQPLVVNLTDIGNTSPTPTTPPSQQIFTVRVSGGVSVGDTVNFDTSVNVFDDNGFGEQVYTTYQTYVITADSGSIVNFANKIQSTFSGTIYPAVTQSQLDANGFLTITCILYCTSINYVETSLSNGAGGGTGVGASTTSDSINILKYGGKYSYGVVYGDNKGRFGSVNVSKTNELVQIPAYYSNTNKIPEISWEIKSQPPIEATWWSLVRTNNLNYGRFIYLDCTVTQLATDNNYLVVKLNNLLKIKDDKILSTTVKYDYIKGDRIRFVPTNTSGGAAMALYDAEIFQYTITATDIEAKIIKPTGFTITGTENALVEIYSLETETQNTVYYEVGEVYPIINAGTSNRFHGGVTQDQTSTLPATGSTTRGDVFLRQRSTDIFDGAIIQSAILIEDVNFSDYFSSKSSSNGRAFIKDSALRKTRFITDMVYTDPITTGFRNNFSNKILPGNYYDEVFESKGAIKKLIVRGDYLITIQERGTCAIPIFTTLIEVGTNATQIGLSRRLLNRPRYYLGDYGIENAIRSCILYNNNIYFVCPSKRAVIRLGFNGMTELTDTTFTSFKIGAEIEAGGNVDNIIGGFDKNLQQYLIHFKTSGNTYGFDERLEGVEGRYSFQPDYIDCFDNQLITFKNGRLYFHNDVVNRNKFYGVQYDSEIKFVFNKPLATKKIFLNTSIVCSGGWYIYKLQTSSGQEGEMFPIDFEQVEEVYYSELPMDKLSDGGSLNGDPLRGFWIMVSMKKVGGVAQNLKRVSIAMIPSSINLV